jgi:hypothetical protein
MSLDGFADLDNLPQALAGRASFDQFAPGSTQLPKPARFFFGDFPAELSRRFFATLAVKPQGVWSLRDAGVYGDCVVALDGQALCSTALRTNRGAIAENLAKYPTSGLEARSLRGTYVLLAGPGHRVYGHWLVDVLPKVYLLDALGHELGGLNILLPQTTPRFAMDWLNLIGIGPDRIVFHDPRRCRLDVEHLLVPTGYRNINRFSPSFADAASFLLRRVEGHSRPSRPQHGGARVFLSRGEAGSRRCSNRRVVERMAEQAGFAVIQPETLPLREQIDLFVGAREIVGEYGSALHGSMFSGAGAVICGLRSISAKHAAFVQSGIADALGQHAGYVFGKASGDDSEVFEIAEQDFSDCLRLVFGGAAIP